MIPALRPIGSIRPQPVMPMAEMVPLLPMAASAPRGGTGCQEVRGLVACTLEHNGTAGGFAGTGRGSNGAITGFWSLAGRCMCGTAGSFGGLASNADNASITGVVSNGSWQSAAELNESCSAGTIAGNTLNGSTAFTSEPQATTAAPVTEAFTPLISLLPRLAIQRSETDPLTPAKPVREPLIPMKVVHARQSAGSSGPGREEFKEPLPP